MKLQRNNVLLEPLKKPEKSAGGVFYHPSENYRDDEKQWRVLACGPGKTVRNPKTKRTHFEPMKVRPGDRVLVEVGLGNKLVFDFPEFFCVCYKCAHIEPKARVNERCRNYYSQGPANERRRCTGTLVPGPNRQQCRIVDASQILMRW